MEAKELRIGNYVKGKDDNYNYRINVDGIKIQSELPDLYEPIPLTEEWLLKFGFKLCYSNCYIISLNSGNKLIFQNDFSYAIYSKQSDYVNGYYPAFDRLKYVHSLQNLYFALEGEEIESVGDSV